ncbi:hypothetical protein NMW28_27065, partial [Escherichia coli]|nr:hypothetical protein [Escherichia coli]
MVNYCLISLALTQHLRQAPVPRLRLFAILCFDSQERREAPRLVYRLDTRGAGLYRRQPVTVPPVPCHLRLPDLMVAQTHTRAS